MITREKEPPNLEMPFSALDGFVTPNERFYVRCHFPIPKINERNWRLKIEGKVARPFEVTMDDLIDPAAWELLPHGTVEYLISPATVLSHSVDHLALYRFLPLAADRTAIEAPAAVSSTAGNGLGARPPVW